MARQPHQRWAAKHMAGCVPTSGAAVRGVLNSVGWTWVYLELGLRVGGHTDWDELHRHEHVLPDRCLVPGRALQLLRQNRSWGHPQLNEQGRPNARFDRPMLRRYRIHTPRWRVCQSGEFTSFACSTPFAACPPATHSLDSTHRHRGCPKGPGQSRRWQSTSWRSPCRSERLQACHRP